MLVRVGLAALCFSRFFILIVGPAQAKADLNLWDRSGHTPLSHAAASQTNHHIIHALLINGAYINASSYSSLHSSALSEAVPAAYAMTAQISKICMLTKEPEVSFSPCQRSDRLMTNKNAKCKPCAILLILFAIALLTKPRGSLTITSQLYFPLVSHTMCLRQSCHAGMVIYPRSASHWAYHRSCCAVHCLRSVVLS